MFPLKCTGVGEIVQNRSQVDHQFAPCSHHWRYLVSLNKSCSWSRALQRKMKSWGGQVKKLDLEAKFEKTSFSAIPKHQVKLSVPSLYMVFYTLYIDNNFISNQSTVIDQK